jgi:hypothetical protein
MKRPLRLLSIFLLPALLMVAACQREMPLSPGYAETDGRVNFVCGGVERAD